MALGVLNNLSAIYAENNLNKTSSSLQTVLQQLSSGSKINSGADDAAGLSLVNGLQANSQALTQSVTNATEGIGLLEVADGALSQVTSLLNRAITLATEASNGTLNTSQAAAANQEYASLLSEINNIGSTTTYNQQQVFTGDTVAIYTGDSSTAGSSVDNLKISKLSASNVGDTNGQMSYSSGQDNVFINLSNQGHNASASDSLNASGTTSLTVNYLTQSSGNNVTVGTATVTVGTGTSYNNTAQGMIEAINASGLGITASFGTAAVAGTAGADAASAAEYGSSASTDTGIVISGTGIGTGTNGVGVVGALSVGATTDTLGGTLTIIGSDGTSHNITLGTANSTDTIDHLESYINEAGWGVTASLDAAGTTMTMLAGSSRVTVSAASLSDTTSGGVTSTISLSKVPTTSGIETTTLGTVTGVASTDTLSGSLVIGANTISIGSSNDTASTLVKAINDGTYGVAATYNSTTNTISFTSQNSSLVIDATGLNDGGSAVTYNTVGSTSSEFYSIGISGSVTDTSTAVTVGGVTTYGGTSNVGMITDYNGTGGIATTSYTDSAGISLAGTDLLSTSNAATALNDLNIAIADVAALDGYIGAQINTLNSVSSVLNTQQNNVVSAQNALQATDYAAATSAMSKYEVLTQTGIAALAQANTVQQEVTKLLQ